VALVPTTTRWERAKHEDLERCRAELRRARARLDALVERHRRFGTADADLEELGPITFEIARLRARDERLSEELAAIRAEWDT
jgi:hypothetical protein